MTILAATDFSTRSTRALRQAGLLARIRSTPLAVVHIVDDDQPKELVELETREAERILAEQANTMPELRAVTCRPMVIAGNPFDGILQAATATQANLIVMGAHRKQLLRDIFVGTTIERVIRTGPFPVLMVNNEAQQRYEKVVAAIDMSESSANALRSAMAAGLTDENRITLVHAFWPFAKGKMRLSGADPASIDAYVENERQGAMDEMAAFLAANDLAQYGWSLRLEEGDAVEVISRVVDDMRPDLLIMGTHGRSGFLKALIGSVTEQALRSLSVDILAVPPVRR
jgi:nucleotide-binding universal stress UspA family protein